MATVLKDFDFTTPSKLTQGDTRKTSYPWGDWFDGRIWKLEEGEDFLTHPLMMERIIRTKASTSGAKLKIRHEPMNGAAWGYIVMQNQAPEDLKIKKSHPPTNARRKRRVRTAAAAAPAE